MAGRWVLGTSVGGNKTVGWLVVWSIFYVHPLFREDSQFDQYFSNGLKAPTRWNLMLVCIPIARGLGVCKTSEAIGKTICCWCFKLSFCVCFFSGISMCFWIGVGITTRKQMAEFRWNEWLSKLPVWLIYRSSRIKEFCNKWDGELESVYFMVKVHFYPHVSDKFLHLNGSLFHRIHTWIFQGVQWMDDGAEKHHTVGFKYHTLEDAPFFKSGIGPEVFLKTFHWSCWSLRHQVIVDGHSHASDFMRSPLPSLSASHTKTSDSNGLLVDKVKPMPTKKQHRFLPYSTFTWSIKFVFFLFFWSCFLLPVPFQHFATTWISWAWGRHSPRNCKAS